MGHHFSRSRSGDSSPPQMITINPSNNWKNHCGGFLFLSPDFLFGASSSLLITSPYPNHAQQLTWSMSSQHHTTSVNNPFQGTSIPLWLTTGLGWDWVSKVSQNALTRVLLIQLWIGYHIGCVHVIFSIHKRYHNQLFRPVVTVPLHLAYIQWYSQLTELEPNHGMFKVHLLKDAQGDWICSIVPVGNIWCSVHLHLEKESTII